MTADNGKRVLWEQGLLLGLEKQRRFEAWNGGAQRWGIDFDAGVLSFDDLLHADVQILGSWASGENTFLWGWALSWPREELTQAAVAMRALGEHQGWSVFTSQKAQISEQNAFMRCLAVVGLRPDLRALYRGPHSEGALYYGLTSGVSLLGDPEVLTTLGVLQDGIGLGAPIRHQPAVEHYLRARGFALRSEGAALTATHPTAGGLQVSFDEHGRLARLQADVTA